MAELRRKLRRLKLSRIDLVPEGAHPGARIEFTKADQTKEHHMGKTEKADLLAKAKAIAEDTTLTLEARRVGWEAARQIECVAEARPDPKAVKFGQLVKARRKALDLDQEQVAKAADLAPSSLSRIESGETEAPSLDTVNKLFEAGVVDLDLLREAGFYRGEVPK